MGIWAYRNPTQYTSAYWCGTGSSSQNDPQSPYRSLSLFFFKSFPFSHTRSGYFIYLNVYHKVVNTSYRLLFHPENCSLLGCFPIRGKLFFSQVLSHHTSLGWGWPHSRNSMTSCSELMLRSSQGDKVDVTMVLYGDRRYLRLRWA